MASQSMDVLVVGGGLSGLCAVHELQKQTKLKIDVLLVEAKGKFRLFFNACTVFHDLSSIRDSTMVKHVTLHVKITSLYRPKKGCL